MEFSSVNGKCDKIVVDDRRSATTTDDEDLSLCFTKPRHLETIEGSQYDAQLWRMKDRMKTVSVALVLCLNVGIDPPDVVKTQPCARLECWIDPLTMSPNKALEKVGSTLQTQYERWQPRARYKQSLDPTTEEVKKLCTSLRRNAKDERVLFHYNGHGVPKPTTNGEIWVFNRQYTQYIPLSIYDLQTWMGSPSIYVYDCSNAGIIVESFKQFALQHETEYESNHGSSPPSSGSQPATFQKCIQLAACAANQVLPMNPDLPADLFTACLTTPIKVALRWYALQSTSKLVPMVTLEEIDSIPGTQSDRRTMKGELNWIFTAITDTIAWNTLPKELFQRLFRQDLLVASLFRNFLLAERIMRSCDCTPISSPPLPPTHQHPMWNAWDLALDLSLAQLSSILREKKPFRHLPFFEEQLTAFQVWLDLGETLDSDDRSRPEQLPIVLQVLLSQIHRMRALELLGRYLDLGPKAVNLALSVGIFPYVLKLLQSCALELRSPLLFIWSKILAIDNTCQSDLVRDGGHKYFLAILQDTSLAPEVRTQAAFCLACIVNNFQEGKEVALKGSLVSMCLEQLNDPHPPLRQWLALCLGMLWDHYDKARWTGVRDTANEKLYALLQDSCPEVRAAAVFALGTFINSCAKRTDHANNIDHSVAMTLINTVSCDMSVLVRKELINALQWIVLPFESSFVQIVLQSSQSVGSLQQLQQQQQQQQQQQHDVTPTNIRRIGSRDRLRVIDDPAEKMKRVSSSSSIHSLNNVSLNQSYSTGGGGSGGASNSLTSLGFGSIFSKIWSAFINLETDPHPEVAAMCGKITGHVNALAKEIVAAREAAEMRNASLSLPPSPNRGGTYLSSDSPPNSASPSERSRTLPLYIRPRNLYQPSTISEESSEDRTNQKKGKRLVSTTFVEWSSKWFAQGANVKKKKDIESKQFYEKEWRIVRNSKIRREAKEEQKKSLSCKLESQVFNTRTAVPPTLLKFHPYDQQIAVAGSDGFSILSWGTGAKNTTYQNRSAKSSKSNITSLEWINGHDLAMLMVGIDDGSVKVFRSNVGASKEPRLITAWQAFNDMKPVNSGLLLSWEQWTQTVVAGGDSRVLRFWDVEKELRAFDLPTGTDSSVTCIDSSFSDPVSHENRSSNDGKRGEHRIEFEDSHARFERTRNGYAVAGCADGSIRLFDRRCGPSDARIRVWMEHGQSVLGVRLLKENLLISAGATGDVKLYDIRKNVSISTQQIIGDIACFDVHNSAGIYSCGSASQSIFVYNLQGALLNSIRSYEGFMGHRTARVTCLSFHPHKVTLATGTADCSVSVYCLEGRR